MEDQFQLKMLQVVAAVGAVEPGFVAVESAGAAVECGPVVGGFAGPVWRGLESLAGCAARMEHGR